MSDRGIYEDNDRDAGSQVADRWEEGIEELEPEDWEYHFGGPEDQALGDFQTEIELIEAESEEDDEEEYEIEDDELEGESGGLMAKRVGSSRQSEIFEWIRESSLGRPVDGQPDTFEVPSGVLIRLKDGNIFDAVSWLSHEGFGDGLIIEDHLVARRVSGDDSEASIVFEKQQIVEAPFGLDVSDESRPPFGPYGNDANEPPF